MLARETLESLQELRQLPLTADVITELMTAEPSEKSSETSYEAKSSETSYEAIWYFGQGNDYY